MAQDQKPHLVVIGSGWVGLYIDQYIDTRTYSITIVSPKQTSAYTPLLASAASGLYPFSCAEESIRANGLKCNFIQAFATAINFEQRQVKCLPAFNDNDAISKREFDVCYDRLVICPGCQTNTFNTPGVTEHALFMKHVSDAMVLRQKIFNQLEKASLPCVSKEEASSLLHVVIVGGGPTGVEISAELSDLAQQDLKRLYPSVAGLLRITIFDVAPNILSAYDKRLYEYATEQLVKRGIEVATGCVIDNVDDSYLHVRGKDPIPYGILLWVAGNKSVPLVDNLSANKTSHGLVRIVTDSFLRVKKPVNDDEAAAGVYADVYALGDAAEIEGQVLPTTAEVAVQEAKYLVRQLNKGPNAQGRPFIYSSKKLVTYIGGHDGISQGLSVSKWSGQEAWISWRSGSFTWTRTWRNWFNIMFAWTLNAVFGRDVMRL
ncbi:hypothetical protein BX600DRAFT_483795 [Xylariales sp. PMI_506]|nr:hypothetical protein BX600DRAFT_483795 [Xylariales sp. PMI_506]